MNTGYEHTAGGSDMHCKHTLTHTHTHTLTHLHTHTYTVSCQLQISSTGANSQPFSNPDRITVGFASDLIVQVLCTSQNVSMSGSNIQWSYAVNDSEVDNELRAFGTSQENGVLRVYPANQLTGEGAMFQCSDGNTVLNVTFDLRKSTYLLLL